ncbi:FAD/NAD(P)-binding domain-containing protein [Xylariaceae sp. FL1019]|nr:FAD/NAD(P)-binding domain-containing protein [Xylariaceae sp. FL1019]
MDIIDVAIIGGGPAGLTAAATLARQLHTAVVFDSKTYRNAKAKTMHMVPGWENKNPQEFRSVTKSDILSNYSTIQFVDVAVTKIDKENDARFKVEDADGKQWEFRKVLLAVGSSDMFPELEGYAELWGERLFHCLFCHGYEDKGASSAGVLVIFPDMVPTPIVQALSMNMAENAAQLSEAVSLYTNGNETLTTQLGSMVSSKFKIEARKIARLRKGSSTAIVEFEDGTQKEEKFLVHHPLTTVQGPFVGQLGISTTPGGDVQAEPSAFHQTNVRGVFAAGDCITPYKVIPGAISSGCNAAVAIAAELQAEKYGLPPMF